MTKIRDVVEIQELQFHQLILRTLKIEFIYINS